MEKLPRVKIMEEAARLSSKRGEQHGPLYRSFGGIAAMWSAYLTAVMTNRTGVFTPIELSRVDVAQMMVNAKQMRAEFGDRTNPENYVDACGYSGIAGELAGANAKEGEYNDSDETTEQIIRGRRGARSD